MRYRKKPIVIDAHQFFWAPGMPDWLHDAYEKRHVFFDMIDGRKVCQIKTLEGWMGCHEGDWILKGVKGEIYPCKDDIFRETYEEVAE
jgi:hypothetical protein